MRIHNRCSSRSDQVDRLQVSLDTFKLDGLTVNTIDNQPIALTVGLTYRIPPQAVLALLYEVGRAGNLDITENFQRIVADRTAKIFAQQNTTRISENREQILNALKPQRSCGQLFKQSPPSHHTST
jgi:SPFH domain / Band 7 family